MCVRHSGIDTNSRSAEAAIVVAITRLSTASALRDSVSSRSKGYATSWNITQIDSCRRDRIQKQNGRFAAFQPNACGTY